MNRKTISLKDPAGIELVSNAANQALKASEGGSGEKKPKNPPWKNGSTFNPGYNFHRGGSGGERKQPGDTKRWKQREDAMRDSFANGLRPYFRSMRFSDNFVDAVVWFKKKDGDENPNPFRGDSPAMRKAQVSTWVVNEAARQAGIGGYQKRDKPGWLETASRNINVRGDLRMMVESVKAEMRREGSKKHDTTTRRYWNRAVNKILTEKLGKLPLIVPEKQ